MDWCQPQEGHQILRRAKRRSKTYRVHGRRYLRQEKKSLQLCCLSTVAKGPCSRGHAGLGDEWEAIAKDTRISITGCGVWLHRSEVRSSTRVIIEWLTQRNICRSVKWLARINAISEPSEAPVQKKEYLYYTPQAGKHNATYSSGFSIQDMPVASAIINPVDKAVIVHDGTIKLRGWAYSGGGHWPERVEVSGDGGSVWYETPYEGLSQKYYHAWRLWSFDLPVDAEGWLELVVRCWDNALNTQPTFVRSAWYVFFRFSSPLYSPSATLGLTNRSFLGTGISM